MPASLGRSIRDGSGAPRTIPSPDRCYVAQQPPFKFRALLCSEKFLRRRLKAFSIFKLASLPGVQRHPIASNVSRTRGNFGCGTKICQIATGSGASEALAWASRNYSLWRHRDETKKKINPQFVFVLEVSRPRKRPRVNCISSLMSFEACNFRGNKRQIGQSVKNTEQAVVCDE